VDYEGGISHPTAAIVLGFVAGILVLLGGLFLGAVSDALNARGETYLAGAASEFGVLGDLFGILLMGLSYGLIRSPDSHVGLGIGILVIGVLSLFGGGGFLIGTILAVLAGILAILFVPDDGEPFPAWNAPPAVPWGTGPGGTTPGPWTPPASPSAAPSSPASPLPSGVSPVSSGKVCAACGTSFDRSRLFCPQCGAAAP
jgi:hypothetical protein